MYTTRGTNKKKKAISNTSYIALGIIVLVAILLTVLIVLKCSGQHFNPDNADRQVRIQWEEVNLRVGYSTSEEIITTLSKGTSVTLTGNSYNCLIGDGLPTDSWTEVQLDDDTTGWVVTTSLKWN